ncbi:hypothetical protein ACHAXR_011173 [Thalassiosira sp. AJA248-18]
MARPITAVAIATVTYLHVASAFSFAHCNNLCNHCISLKNANCDSIEEDGEINAQEKIDPKRRRRRRNLENWGVEHHPSPASFPSTFEEVADEVFRAISGTICGLQRPDPNVASNAMHESVLDYRPTQPTWASKRRWANGDDEDAMKKQQSWRKEIPARIGIEIDGAAYLSDQPNDEGRAMRIVSLQIAQRLSTLPWDDMESSAGLRSVALYFNSMEQSLLASRELSRWKDKKENNYDASLDCIYINCLGQDSLPSNMVKEKGQHNQQRSKNGNKNTVPGSIILVVKPTDFDTDSLVPIHDDSRSFHVHGHQPTIQVDVVEKLQTLLFQASASSIPAVVLSPRLSELPPLQQPFAEDYKKTGPSGFEQSGFQKSATFGGIEPPVGPTSWLLRDLVPPVYVWAGCANTIGQRKNSRRSLRSIVASFRQQQQKQLRQCEPDKDGDEDYHEGTYTYYSRVALTQSAMETGHSWHMFAVKERLKPLLQPSVSTSRRTVGQQVERDVSYHYMGSSNASRGRPNSRIMKDVFEEFSGE